MHGHERPDRGPMKSDGMIPRSDAEEVSRNFDSATSDLIDGKYRIIRELGQGGMGTVFLVEQVLLRKFFAMKTLLPEHCSSKSIVRFQQEARAASLLNHEGLIKVHDFGLLGDRPYFVMDYVDGESLSERIRAKGPLPIQIALPIFIQVAHALAYAHERGIVHRDLKPGNIMLAHGSGGTGSHVSSQSSVDSDPPTVKIVDFGIAKLIADEQPNQLTRTGEVFGSPNYMSPEQCLGVPVDHRSDIYSFGCVLYEALTGFPPFVADTALSVMMKHQSEPVTTLREATLGKEFPQDLEKIVAKLLAKNPEDRYGNLSSVAYDLERLVSGHAVQASGRHSAAPAKKRINYVNLFKYAACILVFTAGFAIANFQIPHTVAPNKTPKAVPSSASQATTLRTPPPVAKRETPAAKAYMEKLLNDPKFKFSEIKKDGSRVFHFPPHTCVGTIDYPNWVGETCYPTPGSKGIMGQPEALAIGDVTIPHFKPFAFTAIVAEFKHPQIFRAFREDELSDLRFRRFIADEESNCPADLLKYVGTLKSLRHISLNNIEIDDGFEQYISDLPQLDHFDCTNLPIRAKNLLKFKRLNHLKTMDISGIIDAGDVIKSLRNPQLQVIRLNSCNITDEDLKTLVENCPNLYTVDASNNPKVDDRGIAYLAKLPRLRNLYVRHCGLTPQVAQTLLKFPILAEADLQAKSWSPSDRIRVSRVLGSKLKTLTAEEQPDGVKEATDLGLTILNRRDSK